MLLLRPAPVEGVEPDREHQNGADDDVLQRSVDAENTIPDCSDCISTAASIAPATVPTPPDERRAADDGGSDHQEFGEDAVGIGRGVKARDGDGAADGGRGAPSA